ncbi:hypothetical protein V8G54_011711 [Vigna mungo]|uniref:Uncharacterized protein n=1 Tax=Vigna mungo TaxID=3915 RepID=A0AAQ3NPM5_VIGMU
MSESSETQKRESADSRGEKDSVASKKPKIEACAKGSDDNGVKEPSFLIEADAAEDKGSRLTMEDAWVVLLDAIAHIGDAKAVLARSTDGSQNPDGVQALKAIVLTREHKPIFPLERTRIQKA